MGPDLVVVPNLAGMSLQQAKDTLAANGFALGATSGDPNKTVLVSTPGAGSQAPRGSAIAVQFTP
jgi:beta-lactam-binding protein with PASTA domain